VINLNEQELISLLEKRTAKHANQNIEKYIQEVAVWVSKILISETKTKITFEYAPPWDSSGQTYNTGHSFDIGEYDTLDSFIENEYNDSSHASFVSGMGIFHDFYSNELDELTDNWVALQLEETVDLLLKEKNQLILEYAKLREIEDSITQKCQYKTAKEISQLIYTDDIIGDFLVIDYSIELKRQIGQMDIKLLFKLGNNQAHDELRQEENTSQKRKEEQIINKEKVDKFWKSICRLHRIRYQKDMPQKIEKDYYDQFLYPFLKEEFKENDDILKIRLLGQFVSYKFSNSVAIKLINYEQ
jgi:hypothetical protein